jgi:hypothetical protein
MRVGVVRPNRGDHPEPLRCRPSSVSRAAGMSEQARHAAGLVGARGQHELAASGGDVRRGRHYAALAAAGRVSARGGGGEEPVRLVEENGSQAAPAKG